MNIALWTVQGILALIFLASGGMKATVPREILLRKLPAVGNFTTNTIRCIGISEIFGSLGLILPGVTGIALGLTPVAAVGLSIIMVPAAIIHLRRKEPMETAVNFVLLAMTIFVAWGRFSSYSF